jgi:glycosyltransferase involved in cell wall biosynthesis
MKTSIESPLVSVYMTNHNYGKYIAESIDSVLNQTFSDYELIIIDDGSTDNSKEVIGKYEDTPKVTIIYQDNKGLNVTNNIAIKLSKGKYIMRLDADDYLDENALMIMSNRLNKSEDGLVFSDYYLVDEFGSVISLVRRHDFKNDVKLYDQPAHGACTMIRKEFLLEVNCYSEEFQCQDGFELWLKFIRRFEVSNINLPLFYYRQHSQNLTKKQDRVLSTRHRIIKKHVSHRDVSKKNHICIMPVRGMDLFEPIALTRLGGKTIIDIAIETVLASENISNIVVSTPDIRVIKYLKKKSYGIILDHRPKELAQLNTHIKDTIEYIIKNYKKEINIPNTITIYHIEYPLRKTMYVDKLINTLYFFEVDSVVGVVPESSLIYKHEGNGLVPINGKDHILSLEREFLYRETPGLVTVDYPFFRKQKKVIGGKVGHVVVDEEATINVTSDLGWRLSELLYKNKKMG